MDWRKAIYRGANIGPVGLIALAVCYLPSACSPTHERDFAEAKNLDVTDRAAGVDRVEEIMELYDGLQEAVPELTSLAIHGQNEDVRYSASHYLIYVVGVETASNPGAVTRLVEKAIQEGTQEQQDAAWTLTAESGELAKDLIPLLVHELRDEHSLYRAAAARALGQSKVRARVVPELLHVYESCDENNDVLLRAEAGWALAKLGILDSVGGLVNYIQHRDAAIRFSAVEALGYYESLPDEAVIPLCKVAKNDANEFIRAKAVESLSHCAAPVPECVRQVLLNSLQNRSTWIREASINAVKELRLFDPKISKSLINIAVSTRRFFVYEKVQDAMVASGDECIEFFVDVFENGESKESQVAAEVLASVSAKGVEELSKSIFDWSVLHSATGIEALGKAHAYADIVQPVLEEAINRKVFAYLAIKALDRLKYKKSDRYIETLCNVVKNSTHDNLTRMEALSIIRASKLKTPEVLVALEAASDDSDEEVADASRELLRVLKGEYRSQL